MWGRKNEPAPAPESAPPVSPSGTRAQESPRPVTPGSGSRPAIAGDRPARPPGQVGKSIRFKGEITGGEDLSVDGEVEGTIELPENSLTVGPNGNVRAHVKARSITVQGRLEGNVQASERIEIRKTGSLEGDLVTPRIVIEDGAQFRGSIDILKPGTPPQAPPSHKPMPARAPIVTPPKQPAAEAAVAVSDKAKSTVAQQRKL